MQIMEHLQTIEIRRSKLCKDLVPRVARAPSCDWTAGSPFQRQGPLRMISAAVRDWGPRKMRACVREIAAFEVVLACRVTLTVVPTCLIEEFGR
jgi:hypothetical protein